MDAKCFLTCCDLLDVSFEYVKHKKYGLTCKELDYCGVAKYYFNKLYAECMSNKVPVNPDDFKPPIPTYNVEFSKHVCQEVDQDSFIDYRVDFSKYVCQELELIPEQPEEGLLYNRAAVMKSTPPGVNEGLLYNWYALVGKEQGVKHGALYNWYAATDVRNICADGWKVPEKTDWDTLIAYCGDSSVAGGKLKEVGSTGATNEFGFNGKLSGHRSTPGVFYLINNAGYFWSLSIHSSTYPAFYSLNSGSTILGYGGNTKTLGYSIRIIKTSTTLTHGETGTYTGNDGKVYRTICIGTQEWLAENLAETLFRDLTPIPEVTNNAAWAALTTAGMCYYNNDIGNAFEISYYDRVSPNGWHLPTMSELNTLYNTISADPTVLNFSQVGIRDYEGDFVPITDELVLWSFDPENDFSAQNIRIGLNSYTNETSIHTTGLAVRLIKDDDQFTEGDTLLYQGKTYRLAKFGNQVVMLDNLAITDYFDTNPIDNLVTVEEWTPKNDGGYCAYNNNTTNVYIAGESLLAPDGWHPAYLGDSLASISLNTEQFNLAWSGYRSENGNFIPYTSGLKLWPHNPLENTGGESVSININSPSGISSELSNKRRGLAVRLVKNDTTPPIGNKLVDIDGNEYDLIVISGKIWTHQNYKATRYKNGDSIPHIEDSAEWSTTENDAYCSFNNE